MPMNYIQHEEVVGKAGDSSGIAQYQVQREPFPVSLLLVK